MLTCDKAQDLAPSFCDKVRDPTDSLSPFQHRVDEVNLTINLHSAHTVKYNHRQWPPVSLRWYLYTGQKTHLLKAALDFHGQISKQSQISERFLHTDRKIMENNAYCHNCN